MRANHVSTISGSRDMKFSHFEAKKAHLSHFWWSKKHSLYETLIGKWVFWLKWVVNQVSTISCSRDMKFSHFKAKKAHLSHFCWSKKHSLYGTLIEKWVFWLKWVVNHRHGTIGSGDMQCCHFQPFLAKMRN